ncbi:MAG: hypothetical protein ACKO04_13730 [Actinomycetes bacterium]
MLVAGVVLVTVSFMVGVAGMAFAVRTVNPTRYERNVIPVGDERAKVPGEVEFRIDEPLRAGTDDDVMSVGIVTAGSGPLPVCTLSGPAGEPVELRSPRGGEIWLRDQSQQVDVVKVARLGPGRYAATCERRGDGSRTFEVGRVIGEQDVRGLALPLLGVLGLTLVAGLLFLVGGTLAVVGLVRRARWRRERAGLPPF